MAGQRLESTQIAQASPPESSGLDWGSVMGKVKHAASTTYEHATELKDRVVAATPGAIHDGVQAAKKLDTPHNRDIATKVGTAAIGVAVLPHAAVAGVAIEAVNGATGSHIPNPMNIKGQIAGSLIKSVTGHDVPDPTHIKQHAVQEALNRTIGSNRNVEHMRFNSETPPAAPSDGADSLSKAKHFASGLIGKAHNILPSMTIDGHDNPTKK